MLSGVKVPGFLPDNDIVRGDIHDYAVEIEWFDMHLERMLSYLEKIGELDNTVVIVTSDNGMFFPRAKANSYDYGVHVPFAVRFPKNFPGGRIVDDPISFVDIAPTILELTGTGSKGMLPMSGQRILNILRSKKQGTVDPSKNICLFRPGAPFFVALPELGLSATHDSQHRFFVNMEHETRPIACRCSPGIG